MLESREELIGRWIDCATDLLEWLVRDVSTSIPYLDPDLRMRADRLVRTSNLLRESIMRGSSEKLVQNEEYGLIDHIGDYEETVSGVAGIIVDRLEDEVIKDIGGAESGPKEGGVTNGR